MGLKTKPSKPAKTKRKRPTFTPFFVFDSDRGEKPPMTGPQGDDAVVRCQRRG
ncbi:hypothetical protein ES332_A11G266800v1 [Gossypium tomentosum]|uniref:Uncharacterized protein n=1 Tax=Gossypium tomentosum TaxID=34277 RepID=A0A5D2NGM5_GOSTO|nr:hypothetical protein ES332_A11G266800v1 [Gossypium tomentosum]